MKKLLVLFLIVILLMGCLHLKANKAKEEDKLGDNSKDNSNIKGNDEVNKESRQSSIVKAIRISHKITDQQIKFIDEHYDYVMTPFLSKEIREKIKNAKLFLYRSIQGTWTGFNHFDWEHIDSNENMFCHSNGNRIKTRWNSWLMDGNDIVEKGSKDELNHWVNYYAITASQQVYDYSYDGLFIDSASHKLSPKAVNYVMPDNYSDKKWQEGRYRALEFIKSYLPDKIVIFNGLHSNYGAEKSLELTDGGMWETFAYNPDTGEYYGEKNWKKAIELFERNKDRLISMVSKKKGFSKEPERRMFIVASYLLVSSKNIALTISDLDYDGTNAVFYYPEYDIYLGKAKGSYEEKDGLYIREFEDGLVIVNPGSSERGFALNKKYYKIVPVGNGIVKEDGSWNSKLEYEEVEGSISITPESGIVLKTIKNNG